jgi:hypothetical protein
MPDVIPALAIVVSALLHVPLPPMVLERTLYDPLHIVVVPVIGIGWYCVAMNLVL